MGKRGPKLVPIIDRFWNKVNKTDTCWLWIARISTTGYGVIGAGGGGNGWIRAHRFSWETANGPIPDGLFVLHKCDIRNCVNPEHLFLGTLKDNSNDMHKKGRNPKLFKKGHKLYLGRERDSTGRFLPELIFSKSHQ